MLKWGAAAALPLLALSGAAQPEVRPAALIQSAVRQQVMVRVRQMPARPSVDWKEGKAVKCLPAREILGAALISQNSVDFVLRDRSRIRARLQNSCPALDYYYGFYITPNADGLVCADRDIIRSRMGGTCEIDRFRTLAATVRR
jgi:hypothetical protein